MPEQHSDHLEVAVLTGRLQGRVARKHPVNIRVRIGGQDLVNLTNGKKVNERASTIIKTVMCLYIYFVSRFQ